MVLSFFLIIIFLLLVPLLLGIMICYVLEIDNAIPNCFVIGFFSLMALCELISVPGTLLKLSFSAVYSIFLFLIASLLVIMVLKMKGKRLLYLDSFNLSLNSFEFIDCFSLIIMMVVVTVIIINSLRLHVIDQDDSRFVVTAADLIRTNTLFLADPNTGVVYDTWSYGADVAKDIVAPHAVFCAILSRSTSTSVTLFMHNIYPIFIYILAVFIYYNLISELIEDIEAIRDSKHKKAYKFLFITIVLLFTIFQYSTKSTREAMFLIRLWQGKAVFAGIIIPALFWILYCIYRKPDKSSYGLLFITSIAGCLTTSMATLILPLMLGVYGIVYGIARRSIKISLFIWSNAIIPVLLALLLLYIRNEMIVC